MFEFKRAIELNQKDYLHFEKHTHRRWRFKPLLIWGAALAITLFIAIIGITHTEKINSLTTNILGAIILFVLSSAFCWAIALGAMLLSKMYRNMLATKAYRDNIGGLKKGELLINERGIQSLSNGQSFLLLWYQIQGMGENEYAIYLYYTDDKAFILPRRHIASLDELANLRAFIKAYANRDLKYIVPE